MLVCCLRGSLKPSASATSALSKLYQHFRVRGHPCGLQDSLSTLRPSCSPCLHGSAMDARLATGGWRALTRQGLSPCKRRQALLGAITLRFRRGEQPQRRRSVATVLIVKRALGMLCAWHRLHVPRLLVSCHGIAHRHELTHAGCQRHLLGFARGAQALGKGFEDRVIANGHEGTHVQGRPPLRTPTPGRAGPPQGATVPLAGRDADEGRRGAGGVTSPTPGGRAPASAPTPAQCRGRAGTGARARARRGSPGGACRGRPPGSPRAHRARR